MFSKYDLPQDMSIVPNAGNDADRLRKQGVDIRQGDVAYENKRDGYVDVIRNGVKTRVPTR